MCTAHLGAVSGVLLLMAATSYEVFRTQCFTRGEGNIAGEVKSITPGSNEEAVEWLEMYHRHLEVGKLGKCGLEFWMPELCW